jgi:ketosteroid isomerase-like protein
MSEDNIRLVKSWFERWNRGERDFLSEETDPEVEIVSRLATEPYRGRDGMQQWFLEIDQQFDRWSLVAEEWRDVGDRVVVLGRVSMRGRGSGVELDQSIGWLIEVSEGRLKRLEMFVPPEGALEAAGLT